MGSDKPKVQNAKITGTMLGYEDHGIFTCMIYLDLSDGGSIGFGGFVLDGTAGNTKSNAGAFIQQILKTVGVDEWEKLNGKHIRCQLAEWGGPVHKIGNLMRETWFEPKVWFEELNK